jgi:hypothetical protein
MPRGKRTISQDASAIEAELNAIKARQAELRAALRKFRSGDTEIRKMEEKLAKQLAGARWLANEIKGVRSTWDEIEFYRSVDPKKPTPRGRRPRSAQGTAA